VIIARPLWNHSSLMMQAEPNLGSESAEQSAAARRSAREMRLRELATNNYRFIWRTLRRLGLPPAVADDAAQQVFVIAAEKIDQIAARAERAFLFQTALRAAMSVRRDLARNREAGDAELELQIDPATQPDEQLQDGRYREHLDRVLNGLEDDLRAVFVLFEIEGLTAAEIATLLEVPPGTVASRLRRAREQFHEAARRLRARLQRGAVP
jgi:RNA polymerase sigma-70 factor, ECF subfamily